MGKFHIWDSWIPEDNLIVGSSNDEPEIYDASNMESAVQQYIKNHVGDGLSDSFTLWVCREGESSPEMIHVRWRYELVVDIEG